jgi:hypothetical protein
MARIEGNPLCRKLFGENLGGCFPQRVRIVLVFRRSVRRHLRTADDHHEELVGTHQSDRRPRSDSSTDQPMA